MARGFKWVKPNWEELEPTYMRHGFYYVCKEDIEHFTASAFALATLKTGMTQEELIANNLDFCDAVDEAFGLNDYLTEDSYQLNTIKELLRVPEPI